MRLTCRVKDTGNLERCEVDEEAPKRLGYGQAALGLAYGYRLGAVQLAAGGAGRKVTVRVGFPAAPHPAPLALPPGPEGAMAIARKVGQGDQITAEGRRNVELQILSYGDKPPTGMDPKLYEAALDALRTATQQALGHYVELNVNALAANFNVTQLTAMDAFRTSPGGMALAARREELGIAMSNAVRFMTVKVMLDARVDYCRAHDCGPPAPAQTSGASSAPSTRTP